MTDAARLELWKAGWRSYQPVSLDELDCAHLRPLEQHLGAFIQVVNTWLDRAESQSSEWSRVAKVWDLAEQWLRMATGLCHVDVDLAAFDAPVLCGAAMDYQEAANRGASLFITEFTRLMYVWNACDLLLHELDLPAVPGANGVFNAAASWLTNSWDGPLPSHYRAQFEHLVTHIRRDPDLATDERLTKATEPRPWRGESAMLLSASQQLRHVLAHGALRLPQPDRWGEDLHGSEPIGLGRLHVPRLGARGLVLALQMVFATLTPATTQVSAEDLSSLWSEDDLREPDSINLRELLIRLHVTQAGAEE